MSRGDFGGVEHQLDRVVERLDNSNECLCDITKTLTDLNQTIAASMLARLSPERYRHFNEDGVLLIEMKLLRDDAKKWCETWGEKP